MAAQHDERKAVKRRGIMAAAAAVLAGMAVKQTSQPVGATTDTNFTASGGTGTAFKTSGASYITGASIDGLDTGVLGTASSVNGVGVSGSTTGVVGSGVFGSATGGGNGVYGTSDSSYGVWGTSNSGTGVYGVTSTGAFSKAVWGRHSVNGYGVYGEATGSGAVGVYGTVTSEGPNGVGAYGIAANNGTGVFGSSASGSGVYGKGTSGYGVYGLSNSIGVYGNSTQGTGVYGQTAASYQYGVLGQTTAANSTAIAGIANQNGSSAFSGGTGNANAFAAYFQGHVQVDGPFDVIGAGNKHAAVPHPDGSHRTIYSIEAPEAWVEDFGEGTLAGGKADIKLDADFAALIHTDHYHVFLTEHDQHNALHVTNRAAGGFVVQADAATATAKGKSATSVVGTFSWRVVAKPKTSAKVERLATVQIADAKALLPDPAKLPKPPEAPKAAVPKP